MEGNAMKAEYLGDEGHLQRDSAEREEYAGAHMRLNRRVPNGTHGGVRGRSLNEWVTSYSILNTVPPERRREKYYQRRTAIRLHDRKRQIASPRNRGLAIPQVFRQRLRVWLSAPLKCDAHWAVL